MADSILRLRVESQEYDNKLKRAAEGIRHLADVAHKGGGELTGLEKAEIDYIKALGDMETKSRSAAGQARELENAFKELTVIYNSLNEVEKADEGGKALAASLETLKQRTLDAKASLNEATQALNGNESAGQQNSSMLEQLASKFTINVDAIKLFNIGLQAADGVLNVAKDAFFSSESNIDEWGRSVEGAKGAYDVFLQTINGGNWSDFFTNLSTAVQGARDLYDALDRLGSVKSNNQAAIAIQQQQVAQLRLMKQQGQNVDEQLKAATERLAQLQSQAVNAGKSAGHETIINTLRNGINGANTTGVNISDGTLAGVAGAIENRGQQVFDNYKRQYESLTKKGLETVQKYDSLTKSYYDAQVFNLENLSKEDQKRYLVARAVTERETEIQKGISIYAQAVNEGAAAAREQFKGNRYALQGTGGSKTNPADQAADKFAQAQKDYQQALELASTQLKAGIANDVEYEKKKLAAEESLWKAIGDARDKYDNPKYKEAQDQAAARILELGGSVKALTEQQEAAKKALQQAEAAYKKESDAADKMADYVFAASKAADNNDLKGFYAANKGLSGMGAGTMDVPVSFTYTDTNLQAFIGNLKYKLSKADYGTDFYEALTKNLADANALGTLIQEAVKNGIDITEFNPQDIWKKIFGENPGDYFSDDFWKTIFASINDKLKGQGKEPISFNPKTGKSDGEKNGEVSVTQQLGSVLGGVNSIVSGLNALGMEIPEEFSKIITGMQTVISITSSIASIVAAIQVISTANLFKLAGGGIVPHAAGGYFVGGNSYSGDVTPIMANAGELVLNKAQQGVLADALEGGHAESVDAQPYVEGDKIILGINNRLRSHGQGEIVTTSMLRRYGLIG